MIFFVLFSLDSGEVLSADVGRGGHPPVPDAHRPECASPLHRPHGQSARTSRGESLHYCSYHSFFSSFKKSTVYIDLI